MLPPVQSSANKSLIKAKIITMTKLALYDKHEGTQDRAGSEYFRHDYIYKKNLGTRIAVGIAGVLLLALYWGRVILIDWADILQIDIRQYLTDSVLFLVALLVLYSLFGTVQGTREYYLMQKRLDQYNGLMKRLERLEQKEISQKEIRQEYRKDPDHPYGADTDHT